MSRGGMALLHTLALAAGLAVATPAAAVVSMTYAKSTTQTINFSQSFTTSQQYTGNASATLVAGAAPVINFLQFNPIGSKGQTLTLTSVEIRLTRTITANINLVNGSGNARSGNLSFRMDSTFSSNPLFSFTNNLGSGAVPFSLAARSQGNVFFNDTATTEIYTISPTNFSPYVGTGSLSLVHQLSNFVSTAVFTGGGQGSLSGTATGTVNGEFEIIYNYLDPVPEPGSWAMLIAGFGMVGAMARRQRRLGNA